MDASCARTRKCILCRRTCTLFTDGQFLHLANSPHAINNPVFHRQGLHLPHHWLSEMQVMEDHPANFTSSAHKVTMHHYIHSLLIVFPRPLRARGEPLSPSSCRSSSLPFVLLRASKSPSLRRRSRLDPLKYRRKSLLISKSHRDLVSPGVVLASSTVPSLAAARAALFLRHNGATR